MGFPFSMASAVMIKPSLEQPEFWALSKESLNPEGTSGFFLQTVAYRKKSTGQKSLLGIQRGKEIWRTQI